MGLSHLFPVVPIHNLDRKPRFQSIIADLTCDSDGKIQKFNSFQTSSNTIPLHKYNKSSYYIGVFLIGAYQEILGNIHNLFGYTNVVNIALISTYKYKIKGTIEGSKIMDVLKLVNYNPNILIKKVLKITMDGSISNSLKLNNSVRLIKTYRKALVGYTYLKE